MRTVLLLLISSTCAWAVCVDGPLSLKKEFSSSGFVMTVLVESAHRVPDSKDGYYFAGTNYKLKTLETFKGNAPSTILVFNENSSGRFDMEPHQKYLLFIRKEHGRFRIDNCGNSGRLNHSGRVLGAIRRLSTEAKHND